MTMESSHITPYFWSNLLKWHSLSLPRKSSVGIGTMSSEIKNTYENCEKTKSYAFFLRGNNILLKTGKFYKFFYIKVF